MAKLIPKSEYTVVPDAVRLGVECHPQVIVEFVDDTGELVREPRILHDRGVYQRIDDALAAAREVVVESVFDNRRIVFAPPK